MLKNKFLVQEWSYGGLSDEEGFYDNDHHQDKDWVPKKITNDTALINIWQPQEQKNALFGPEMSETHLLHPLHFSWEQSQNGHHSILFQIMMRMVVTLTSN